MSRKSIFVCKVYFQKHHYFDPLTRGVSVTILSTFLLQFGQREWSLSHWLRQSLWYACRQCSMHTSSPYSNCSWQTAHFSDDKIPSQGNSAMQASISSEVMPFSGFSQSKMCRRQVMIRLAIHTRMTSNTRIITCHIEITSKKESGTKLRRKCSAQSENCSHICPKSHASEKMFVNISQLRKLSTTPT